MEKLPIAPTAKASADQFTGDVYVTSIIRDKEPSKLVAALVRFTPCARTDWHRHAVGQTLFCTEGVGLVVTRDGTVIRLTPGETVWTPPEQEHWHGATEGRFMCHVAMLETTGEGDPTTWLEKVSDEEYARANRVAEEQAQQEQGR